ncbi:MAG: hypothetical protein D4Q77_02210 [Methanothrix sp.]|nr:MAG: hypothetical protein D4Q77_02210 [Methanothrix sp.]
MACPVKQVEDGAAERGFVEFGLVENAQVPSGGNAAVKQVILWVCAYLTEPCYEFVKVALADQLLKLRFAKEILRIGDDGLFIFDLLFDKTSV